MYRLRGGVHLAKSRVGEGSLQMFRYRTMRRVLAVTFAWFLGLLMLGSATTADPAPFSAAAVEVEKRLVAPAAGVMAPGDIATFEITVRNVGSADLTSLSLSDTYDNWSLSFIDASEWPSHVTRGATWDTAVWADLTAPPPAGFGGPLRPGEAYAVTLRLRALQPRTGATVAEAGLNPFLMEMANVREQCTWVHGHDREGALAKAKDLTAAAIAKARFLVPLDMIKVPVTKRAMVIGGGVAGISAALDLADQGIETLLVEKQPTIGGVMAQLNKTFPTMDCSI